MKATRLAAMFALITILSFVNSPAHSTAASNAAPVTLTRWDIHSSPVYDAWWQTYNAGFTASHAGVTVKETTYDVATYDAKLLTAMSAGQAPDIFYNVAGESIAKYVRAGKVAPLDGLINPALYDAAYLKGLTYNGHIYGVPMSPFPTVMWYNKAIFKKLGLSVPKTWAEFIHACDVIKKAGFIPLSLGNKVKFTSLMYYDYLLYAYGGPHIREDATFVRNGVTWASPPFVEAAQQLKNLIDAGYFQPGFNGVDDNQQEALLLQGKAAMTMMGSWFVGIAEGSGPKGFQLGFFTFPTPPHAKYATGAGGGLVMGYDIYAISASSPNKKLAAAFLDGYARQDAGFTKATGNLPVSPGVTVKDPLDQALVQTAARASIALNWGDRALPQAIVPDYLNNLQELTLGQLSPQQFATTMASVVARKHASLK